MPSLSSIKSPLKTVVVPFGTENVTVIYDPNVITPRLEEDMRASAANGGSAIKAFLNTMTVWITSWDLTKDLPADAPEGTVPEMWPITVDGLSDLSDAILTTISQALLSDMRPNATSS